MTLTDNKPIIIGNHLITGICIDSFEDLESIVRTHSSIALRDFGNNIYGASIVMNWNYSIVSKRIREKSMFVTVNINNIVKQERPKRTNKIKKDLPKEIKCLLETNPLHKSHLYSYINNYIDNHPFIFKNK